VRHHAAVLRVRDGEGADRQVLRDPRSGPTSDISMEPVCR
jgi:hypothetical protein